jgi:regulator of replication initiation timing
MTSTITWQQLVEEIDAIKLENQELRNQLAKKDDIKKELKPPFCHEQKTRRRKGSRNK